MLINRSIESLRAEADQAKPLQRAVQPSFKTRRSEPESEPAQAGHRFIRNPMNWPNLANRTPGERDWVIRHWLPYALTLIVGPGGIGKTLAMIQAGVAISLGRRFIEDIPKPKRVLMWLCEDSHDEIWRRMIAVCTWLRVDMADLDGRLIVEPRVGRENILMSTEFGKPMFTPLLGELNEQVNDYRADVLFLDNIGHVFAANENSRADVTMFANGLVGMIQDRPFAPVLIGHPARSIGSEFAGSGAWENAARMRWFLGTQLPDSKDEGAQSDDSDQRYLCKRKTNYSEKDFLRLSYSNGVLIPDEPMADGLAGTFQEAEKRRAERVTMSAFRQIRGTGQVSSAAKNSPQYLPRLIIDANLADRLSKQQLSAALNKLLLDGKFKVDQVGKYGNGSNRDGLVEVTT